MILALIQNFQKYHLPKIYCRTSDLKLSTKITINVNYENDNQKYVFNESINIKNDTDSFEQRNYEKTIKENFASSAVNKLIIKISSL